MIYLVSGTDSLTHAAATSGYIYLQSGKPAPVGHRLIYDFETITGACLRLYGINEVTIPYAAARPPMALPIITYADLLVLLPQPWAHNTIIAKPSGTDTLSSIETITGTSSTTHSTPAPAPSLFTAGRAALTR